MYGRRYLSAWVTALCVAIRLSATFADSTAFTSSDRDAVAEGVIRRLVKAPSPFPIYVTIDGHPLSVPLLERVKDLDVSPILTKKVRHRILLSNFAKMNANRARVEVQNYEPSGSSAFHATLLLQHAQWEVTSFVPY